MIHLFKKVYVATDHTISIDMDRVVISEENGVALMNAYETVASGNLIMYNTTTAGIISEAGSWQEFFVLLKDYTNNTNKQIVIYCDDTALLEVLCAWFNSLLPNATESSVKSLISGLMFRYNVFGWTNKMSETRTNDMLDIDSSSLTDAYNNTSSLPLFTDNGLINSAGVEFLLATYLSSGDKKEELKAAIKPLIRKDLDKYMLEQREIFFAHCITRRFRNALNFGSDITYDNISEIFNDTSKYPSAMLNTRVWNYKYMSIESTVNSAVNFEAMTAEDIQDIKDFTAIASSEAFGWTEEAGYIGVTSDVSKLDFLPIFTSGEFTDEMLTLIINTESTFAHAAGSFFSIDLATVNHYLIEELLERNNQEDTSWISKYSLVASS